MSYAFGAPSVDEIDVEESVSEIVKALEKAAMNGKPVKCKFKWSHPGYGTGELTFSGKAGANNESKAKRELSTMFELSMAEVADFEVELLSERLIVKKPLRA